MTHRGRTKGVARTGYRRFVAMLAAYALLVQAFVAVTLPAEAAPSGFLGVICGHDAGPSTPEPKAPALPDHGAACCVLCGLCHAVAVTPPSPWVPRAGRRDHARVRPSPRAVLAATARPECQPRQSRAPPARA